MRKGNYKRRRADDGGFYPKTDRDIALLALARARQACSAVKPEVSAYDESGDIAVGSTATTVAVQDIFDPDEGTGVNERTGDRVKALRIKFKGYVVRNSAATFFADLVRIVIIKGNNERGISPSALNVWGSSTPAITANIVHNNRGNFRILWDKTFVVTDTDPYALFDANFKLDFYTQFGTTAGFAEDGGVYLHVWTSATANTPGISIRPRIFYYDT